MESRKVTVVCGTGRRFVDVDFSNYERTMEAVRRRWKLTGDFILQATVGEKGDHYDIIDDDDLADFKDSDTLIVRLPSHDVANAGASQSFIQGAVQNVDDSVSPPTYEQSLQHNSQVPCVERRMPVTFEGIRKLVKVDAQNYQGTKNAIRQKFEIEGEFDFQGKLRGQDDYFDIRGDNDIHEVNDAESILVKRRDSKQCTIQQAGDKGGEENGQKRMTVICDGTRKLVNVDTNSLENTKDAINLKFTIGDDFDVQGKLHDEDEYFDIQNDVDMQDFHDAESFQVRMKVNQCDGNSKFQVGQKQAEKKTTVIVDGVRKLVPLDMKSLENSIQAIRHRFHRKGDIELCAKLPGNEEYYNIQDDQDLADFNDAVEFVAKLQEPKYEQNPEKEHASTESFTPAMDQHVFTGHPPRAGHQPPTFLTQVATDSETKTLLVKFEGKNKKINVDLGCLRSTRNAIRQKFNLDGDFPGDYQLLAKTKGAGDYFDIDDDDDLGSLGENDILLVERRSTNENRSESGSMEVVDSSGLVLPMGHLQVVEANTISIKGVMYEINDQPPSNSALVIAEAEDLAANFDIAGLVDNTEVVADCLRLARFGVIGHLNLHESIGKLLSNVAELTRKTNSAVIHFRMKAGDILSELISAVGFLQDGENEIANKCFEKIRTNSAFLKQKSETLTDDIKVEGKKIEEVLAGIHKMVKGRNDEEITMQSRRKDELQRHADLAKKDREDSEARAKKIEGEIDVGKSRVRAAMDKDGCDHGCSRGFCCHGSCPCRPWSSECCYRCCGGGLFCSHLRRRYYWYWRHLYPCHHGDDDKDKRVDSEKKLQKKAEEDRLQELKERQKLRKLESNANEKLTKFIEAIGAIDHTKKPEDLSDKALRGAEVAIQSLLASMASSVTFWEKLNVQCNSIGSTGDVIKNLEQKNTEEKRKEFMAKPSFKKGAVKYYAMLVALRHMCEAFHRNIKMTETNILLSIVDNPSSIADAREKIPILVKDLKKKIEDIKKAGYARVAADDRESGQIQARLAGKEYK